MKKVIVAFFVLLFAGKFALAGHLDLFGDEAFYWQCGQRPALSYIDHPPVTAMLVRAGTELLGDRNLGVRFFFLLCGMAFPFAMYALAFPLTGKENAWRAAGLTMVFPPTAHLGLVAVPDVPMLLLAVLFLTCFERATREASLKYWILAGICGAFGLLTHYRFILMPVAALLYLVFTPRGRSLVREKGPWITGGLLIMGVLPSLLHNLQTDFVPIRYHLEGRHGLDFSSAALIEFLLLQLFITLLVFLIAWLGVLVMLLKRAMQGNVHAIIFSIFSLTCMLVFLAASPFENSGLTTLHWTAMSYVVLLPFVPEMLSRFVETRPSLLRKTAAGLIPVLGGIVILAGMLELGTGCFHIGIRRGFVGWSETVNKIKEIYSKPLKGEYEGRPILVADNYILAANLDFHLHEHADVYVLDHEKGRRHGRGQQYHIWNMDEKTLKQHTGADSLLIIEETEYEGPSLKSWKLQRRMCSLFESVTYLDDLRALYGKKQFIFLSLKGLKPLHTITRPVQCNECKIGIISCLDVPRPGSSVSGTVRVAGWAFRDCSGVQGVEVLVEGESVGIAEYGIPRPDVKQVFKESTDPNLPNVGFAYSWDSSRVEQGRYRLAIRVTTTDGAKRILYDRGIRVVAPEEG